MAIEKYPCEKDAELQRKIEAEMLRQAYIMGHKAGLSHNTNGWVSVEDLESIITDELRSADLEYIQQQECYEILAESMASKLQPPKD